MKIGVNGASGQLGQIVLHALLDNNAGHDIIAITRTPQSALEGVEARLGDYDHPETLATAYAGLDRLLLIPSSAGRPGLRGVQIETAIKAAVAAGVKHIVYMSAAGTRAQPEPEIGASYWRGEQTLMANAPAWTILRMNYYTEALAMEVQSATQSGVLTGIAENKVAFVSRADVGRAAAGILLGEGHEGAIYNATGPKAWSGAERAALIAELTGKPVTFMALPADVLTKGMIDAGLPTEVVNMIIGIQKDFANGAFDVVTGDVEKLTGQAPRDLREALAALIQPLSA